MISGLHGSSRLYLTCNLQTSPLCLHSGKLLLPSTKSEKSASLCHHLFYIWFLMCHMQISQWGSPGKTEYVKARPFILILKHPSIDLLPVLLQSTSISWQGWKGMNLSESKVSSSSLVSERNSTWPKALFTWCFSYFILSYFMCLLHSCLLKTCYMMQALEVKIISKVNVVPALQDLMY